ncbi:MAG: hypothetical protein P9M07_07930 [Candidatus Aceula meridiana]|nr:hypothetical protein [Candidatus Aceula meridiana]
MAKTKVLQGFLIFLGFLVLLSVVYWPTISSYYFYHDDVIYFLQTQVRIGPPGTLFNIAIGRFIGAGLFMAISWLINCIDDLKLVRFISILQLSGCGLLMTLWMRKHFLKFLEANLLALIILTLPPFQIPVCQAGMAFQPFGILVAIGAAILAYKIPVVGKLSQRILNRYFFLAVFLMLCSLSIYQSAAMFYWALVGFVILFSKRESFEGAKQEIINMFFVGFVALIVYRIILQISKGFFTQYNLYGYNPFGTTKDIIGKIVWYFQEPVFNALNLWNIFGTNLYAGIVIFVVALGLCFAVVRKHQDKERISAGRFVFKAAALGAIFFLCSLPNLVIENNVSFYRCYFALGALVVFALAWSLKRGTDAVSFLKKRDAFFVLLLILGLYGMVQAYQTVLTYRVNLSVQETEFFLSAMRKKPMNSYKGIYIIRPDSKNFRTDTDEYGNLTTFFAHNDWGIVSCALREFLKGKLRIYHILVDHQKKELTYLFEDLHDKEKKYVYKIRIISGKEKKTQADFREPTLIIDMAQFIPQPREIYAQP